jgi:serine/threonine protein kinase
MSTFRGQHLIGQEIGSCILEKQLGHGGSSAVFLAQSRSSDEKVAVKVFLPRSTMDKQTQKNFYRRFLREAQAASELDHPNILSIYSYGEHNGLPYIVMPYMSGGTLSEYVAKHGPLSLSEAQQYLEQISSALDYAHEHGHVHCDVKPANILLDDLGHVVLSDFGIVRLMHPDPEATLQSIKSSEILMGTPDYISPEQALGQPLDGRSDVYSLAVTLFFLLAGKPPFKAESSIAMALMHVHEKPPVLGMMRADITPQIDSVIGKALSKWPEERFQAAGEFSSAFAEAVTNADQSATPASGAKRKANGSNSEGKQSLAALKPIVQVKPTGKRSFKLQRVVLPLILLLAVIIGSVVTVNIIGKFTSEHPQQATSSTKQTDYLADDKQDMWPHSPTNFFKHGQYHIKNVAPLAIAIAYYVFGNYQFTNFRLTVTASEIAGKHDGGDYYGVVFRSSTDQLHYYLFEIAATASGGQYGFWRCDGQTQKPLAIGNVPSLLPNLGQSNVIKIQVKDSTFSFSVNQQSLGTVTDTSKPVLSSGDVGLSVEEQNTEVAFSHLLIDKL